MRYYELLETATDYWTRAELLAKFPEVEQDIADVGLWMETDPEQLKYRLVIEPFSVVEDEAKSMYDTYPTFPKEAKRTNKIVKLLKQGAKVLPVFIEEGDSFVMEGRHRTVAHLILGSSTIPVVYVSK